MVGPFRWNDVAARYIDARGRFVSRLDVRHSLDGALDTAQRRMIATAEDFRAGRITLEAWRAQMAVDLKEIHLYSAAIAKGGWDQMTPADFGRVGRILRDQYEYLNNFTMEIVAEIQALDGRFLSRVKLYAQSGRVTYHATDRSVQGDAGMTEMRNVLHPAEHCGDCLDMTALDWIPLDDPDYLPIGGRQCLSNDRCTEEFR